METNSSVIYGILVGIIAGVLSTLVEAYVAFHNELYFLWPWVGFFLYIPGLLTVLITGVALTYMLMRFRMQLGSMYGIAFGAFAMLTFFIFDNLLVFPIFVAPVVWPWQDFFFNFRFLVGLIDTLANGFLIFFIGVWIEKKYISETISYWQEIFGRSLGFLKYSILILMIVYLILMPAGVILSVPYFTSNQFYFTLIAYVTPAASIILICLWWLSFRALPSRKSVSISEYTKAYTKLLRNVIINGIVNETAFFYEIFFLYPFGLSALLQRVPNISAVSLTLIQAYLTVISFQMIIHILALAFLLYLKE